jgi:hypothetical protein
MQVMKIHFFDVSGVSGTERSCITLTVAAYQLERRLSFKFQQKIDNSTYRAGVAGKCEALCTSNTLANIKPSNHTLSKVTANAGYFVALARSGSCHIGELSVQCFSAFGTFCRV